jgi:hypothetical protein
MGSEVGGMLVRVGMLQSVQGIMYDIETIIALLGLSTTKSFSECDCMYEALTYVYDAPRATVRVS